LDDQKSWLCLQTLFPTNDRKLTNRGISNSELTLIDNLGDVLNTPKLISCFHQSNEQVDTSLLAAKKSEHDSIPRQRTKQQLSWTDETLIAEEVLELPKVLNFPVCDILSGARLSDETDWSITEEPYA